MSVGAIIGAAAIGAGTSLYNDYQTKKAEKAANEALAQGTSNAIDATVQAQREALLESARQSQRGRESIARGESSATASLLGLPAPQTQFQPINTVGNLPQGFFPGAPTSYDIPFEETYAPLLAQRDALLEAKAAGQPDPNLVRERDALLAQQQVTGANIFGGSTGGAIGAVQNADRLRQIEQLNQQIEASRQPMSPEEMQILETELATIEAGIEDARTRAPEQYQLGPQPGAPGPGVTTNTPQPSIPTQQATQQGTPVPQEAGVIDPTGKTSNLPPGARSKRISQVIDDVTGTDVGTKTAEYGGEGGAAAMAFGAPMEVTGAFFTGPDALEKELERRNILSDGQDPPAQVSPDIRAGQGSSLAVVEGLSQGLVSQDQLLPATFEEVMAANGDPRSPNDLSPQEAASYRERLQFNNQLNEQRVVRQAERQEDIAATPNAVDARGVGFGGASEALRTGFNDANTAQAVTDDALRRTLQQTYGAESEALLPALRGAVDQGLIGFDAAGNIVGAGGSSAEQQLRRGEAEQLGMLGAGGRTAQRQLGQGGDLARGDVSAAARAAVGVGDPALQSGLRGIEAYTDSALNPDSALMRLRLGEASEALDSSLAARGLFRSSVGADQQRKLIQNVTAEEAQRQVGLQQSLANMGLSQIGSQQGILTGAGSQLAGIAERGGQGASQLTQSQAAQQAGVIGQGAGQLANLSQTQAGQLGDLALQRGLFGSEGLANVGQAQAGLISKLGEGQLQRIGNTGANMANLAQAQGAAGAGLAERTGSNLAQLQMQGGLGRANVSVGQGTQAANLIQSGGTNQANLLAQQGQNAANVGISAQNSRAQGLSAFGGGLMSATGKVAGAYAGRPQVKQPGTR